MLYQDENRDESPHSQSHILVPQQEGDLPSQSIVGIRRFSMQRNDNRPGHDERERNHNGQQRNSQRGELPPGIGLEFFIQGESGFPHLDPESVVRPASIKVSHRHGDNAQKQSSEDHDTEIKSGTSQIPESFINFRNHQERTGRGRNEGVSHAPPCHHREEGQNEFLRVGLREGPHQRNHEVEHCVEENRDTEEKSTAQESQGSTLYSKKTQESSHDPLGRSACKKTLADDCRHRDDQAHLAATAAKSRSKPLSDQSQRFLPGSQHGHHHRSQHQRQERMQAELQDGSYHHRHSNQTNDDRAHRAHHPSMREKPSKEPPRM